MRKFSKAQEEAEINMTPMLDIVFIMLIFFIVTASFIKEAGVTVEKERASYAEQKTKASILVAITDNDEIWINKRQVELKSVRTVIERLQAENPQGQIVVQADKEAKSGITLDVVDAIKNAGVEDISLAAEKT